MISRRTGPISPARSASTRDSVIASLRDGVVTTSVHLISSTGKGRVVETLTGSSVAGDQLVERAVGPSAFCSW